MTVAAVAMVMVAQVMARVNQLGALVMVRGSGWVVVTAWVTERARV